MKIASIGYQQNYGNNKSKSVAMNNQVHFTSLESAAAGAVKKSTSLSETTGNLLMAMKKKVGRFNVKAESFDGLRNLLMFQPQNLKVSSFMKLQDYNIKGLYISHDRAQILGSKVAENGRLYVDNVLEGIQATIKGRAVSNGDAVLFNSTVSEGGFLKVKNNLRSNRSELSGNVHSKDARLIDTNLKSTGSLYVDNSAVVGKGSVVEGLIDSETLYLKEGGEIGPKGVSLSESLYTEGKIKGLALANDVVIDEKGSIEKGGRVWAKHIHFNDFMPEEGQVIAEKITIGSYENPLVLSKPEDVPKEYKNIQIKTRGWYSNSLNALQG